MDYFYLIIIILLWPECCSSLFVFRLLCPSLPRPQEIRWEDCRHQLVKRISVWLPGSHAKAGSIWPLSSMLSSTLLTALSPSVSTHCYTQSHTYTPIRTHTYKWYIHFRYIDLNLCRLWKTFNALSQVVGLVLADTHSLVISWKKVHCLLHNFHSGFSFF